jgi:hypothetical protein
MKRIGIEINGVLRDTILKFTQLYEKYLIEKSDVVNRTFELSFSGESSNEVETTEEDDFVYEITSEVDSLELMSHFKFKNSEELFSFMYEEYTMELFGHAPSKEMNSFNLLNDFYYDNRDEFNILIVSNEIGKSKPASLFFLSKFGCLIEQVLFYSEVTKNAMWDSVDILLTADPYLLLNKPEDKLVIKYNTEYNKQISSEYEINSLSELNQILKNLKSYV